MIGCTTASATIQFKCNPLPSCLFFTNTPYATFQYIKKELINITQEVLGMENLTNLQNVNLEYSTNTLTEEEAIEIDEVLSNIKELMMKMRLILEWRNNILENGFVTNKEIEKKIKYINAQTNLQLRNSLMLILEQALKKIEIVSPFEKINNTRNIDDIVDELYELGNYSLLNLGKTIRDRITNLIITNRPFSSENELNDFIEQRVAENTRLIVSLNTFSVVEEVISTINKIDSDLLSGLSEDLKYSISQKIQEVSKPFRTYSELFSFVSKNKEKELVSSRDNVRTTINLDELRFFTH